jgi:hypothetical protein
VTPFTRAFLIVAGPGPNPVYHVLHSTLGEPEFSVYSPWIGRSTHASGMMMRASIAAYSARDGADFLRLEVQDGRIHLAKIGTSPPDVMPAPQRPGAAGDDEEESDG